MKKTFARLLGYMGKSRGALLLSALCAAGNVLCVLLAPVLIGRAVDAMAAAGQVDFAALGRLVLWLAGLYLAGNLLLWSLSRTTNRLSYDTVGRLRAALYAKLDTLPLAFFDGTPRGDTVSRFVVDADAIADGLLQGTAALLTGGFTLVGSLVFMLRISAGMTAAVLATAPITYFVARAIALNSQSLFKKTADRLGALSGYAEETIDGARVVKSFYGGAAACGRFGEMNAALCESGVKAQFISSITNPSTRIVGNLSYTLVGVIGCLAAIRGTLTVGEISSFLIFSAVFAKPLNDLTNVTIQIQSAAASAQRVFQVLDAAPEPPDAPDASVLADCRGEVEFRDVSFSYTPGTKLIEHFDLRVVPGSRIAIVGRTGAGKTTLVNLLMRFYDVTSGAVLVDGRDIRDYTRGSLRRSIGMVLQETWLMDGTIRENIAYARPDASAEEVAAAARAAGADAFISRLPKGYDTLLGGSGDTLSQGQRQLLTIARVMLARPPMVVLDEATSSIDTLSELRIQKAFAEMTAGRTSFVIAHRLSTIRSADLILVMDAGHIAEEGTHDELLRKNGVYAGIYRSQFAGQAT